MPNPSTTNAKLDVEIKERVRASPRPANDRRTGSRAKPSRSYVEREETRAQFRQDALPAWAHYQVTGLHFTAEEADAWLAKLAAGKDAAPPRCRA
jgi:predicted transcriptional regulator